MFANLAVVSPDMHNFQHLELLTAISENDRAPLLKILHPAKQMLLHNCVFILIKENGKAAMNSRSKN